MLSDQTLLAFSIPALLLAYVFYSWLTHKDR